MIEGKFPQGRVTSFEFEEKKRFNRTSTFRSAHDRINSLFSASVREAPLPPHLAAKQAELKEANDLVIQEYEEEKDQIEDLEQELDDDGAQGIGFQSFELLEMAGKGTFGKVFKVRKRDNGRIYAMKVLKKSFLMQRNYLKYAITECNILKQSANPYVIKMHYAF